MLNELKVEMQNLKNSKKAKILSRFFKTGKGEYGEGDNFFGINVPEQRKLAKKYYDLNLDEIQKLLSSNIHEYRMTALFILVDKYQKADNKEEIVNLYLKNTKNINNWDLVDLTAPNILGNHLLLTSKHSMQLSTSKHSMQLPNRNILYSLANSNNLWEKRIAVLSTFAFIRNNQFEDSLKIAEILLKDKHDLIHKAVGWMLREIGKRDLKTEEAFLARHCSAMPRTMLRYAIEKFDERKRKFYLSN